MPPFQGLRAIPLFVVCRITILEISGVMKIQAINLRGNALHIFYSIAHIWLQGGNKVLHSLRVKIVYIVEAIFLSGGKNTLPEDKLTFWKERI